MWLNLAAAAGESDAADERDKLEERMSPATPLSAPVLRGNQFGNLSSCALASLSLLAAAFSYHSRALA